MADCESDSHIVAIKNTATNSGATNLSQLPYVIIISSDDEYSQGCSKLDSEEKEVHLVFTPTKYTEPKR